jgi:hypothetical protein
MIDRAIPRRRLGVIRACEPWIIRCGTIDSKCSFQYVVIVFTLIGSVNRVF